MKTNGELEVSSDGGCIAWVNAVFNVEDNEKIVTCRSTHISGMESEDTFRLNILRKLKFHIRYRLSTSYGILHCNHTITTGTRSVLQITEALLFVLRWTQNH